MRLANVAGHHADAGRERLVPDPGLLHGGAQALQPVLGVGRPYQAVHDQATLQAQQFAQHEAAHEPGRPGQQHLPHLRDRHRRGRPAVTDGAANERAQAVQVALTLRRQRAGQRRYSPVGCGDVRHARSDLIRRRSETGLLDDLATLVKAAYEFAVETAKLVYDVVVIKVRVSANEVALPFVTSMQMRDDGCVHDRVRRRETVRALISSGVVQHRRVEWNQFGGT